MDEWFQRKAGKHKLPEYLELIEKVRNQKYPVTIKFGLEICYFKQHEAFIEKMTKNKGFDFLLGSIHFVDDFAFVMRNKEDILNTVPLLDSYLKEQLLLKLHPKKIYIQHHSKGVLFVGAFILPGRIYISNRVVGNLYDVISKYNKIAEEGFAEAHADKFVATLNSYYGLMRHFNTYNLRRKVAKRINPAWWEYFYVQGHWEVFVLKNEYNFKKQLKKQIRKGNAKKYLTPEIG